MVAPDIFPDAPVQAPTRSRDIGAGIGNLLDKLMDQSDRIQSERGPLAAELFRGVAEGSLRRAGLPITLKTPEERAQEEQIRFVQQADLDKKTRNFRTEGLIAEILSDPDMGTAPLSELIGEKIDGRVLDDDESMLRISQLYAKAVFDANTTDRSSPDEIERAKELARSKIIGREDLFFLRGEGLDSPEEVAATKLGRRAKALGDQQKVAESIAATQEGRVEDERSGGKTLKGSPVARRLLQELAAGEERLEDRGEPGDIGDGEDFLDDDFDEGGGAAEAVRAILNTVGSFDADPKSAILGILTGKTVGKRISSIIRGATNLNPESGFRTIIEDDSEATPALLYIGLIDRLAAQIPEQDVNDLFTTMGLEAPDEQTLNRAVETFNKGAGG